MLQNVSSSILIGTLKAWWTVYPFSNNVLAIPVEAHENIIKSSDNNLVNILLTKNDFPLPPGASINIIPGLFSSTFFINVLKISYYSSVHLSLLKNFFWYNYVSTFSY